LTPYLPLASGGALAGARGGGGRTAGRDEGAAGAQCRVYNPYFLDDPEMRISKDRTVIKQEGYVVSCVPYVKPRTMKEELNGLFLAKHGDWLEDREVARLALLPPCPPPLPCPVARKLPAPH
jgi:hypothetical protein